MSNVAFDLGFVQIYWYSIMVLLGILFGSIVIFRETKKQNINEDFRTNLVFYGIILGLIGARLYYVLFNWSYYSSNPIEILEVWNGGLAIHGGILFALLFIIFFTKKHKVSTLKVLDILAVGLLIGQCIGRWGNFFNGEAYGSVIEYDKLASIKIIPQFIIDNMYINGNYHLPMFYFESIACLIGFILLLIIRRQKYIKRGQIVGTYLVWYGVVRIIIEIFRSDSLMFFDIKVAQLVNAVMIIIGTYLIGVQVRKPTLEDLYNTYDDKIMF